MKTPLHFLEDAGKHNAWHISNQHGPLCGAETSGTDWHLPDDDFVKVKLCLACWDIVSEVQQFIAPAPALLAAACALIAYRDAAGPLGFQLEKADDFINALRAAVAKAEGGK